MIGVPLSGGKTLNVTFRSLNTRGDVFKSYNQTGQNSPVKKINSNEKLRGQAATTNPTSPIQNSAQLPKNLTSSGNNTFRSSAERSFDDSMMKDNRKEELKKVVQLGVMRGLSSHKQTRKNSRTSRLMIPNEKTYMQIKMRNDGVVPFQNVNPQQQHDSPKM